MAPGNTTSCGFVPAGLYLIVVGRIRPRGLLDFGFSVVFVEALGHIGPSTFCLFTTHGFGLSSGADGPLLVIENLFTMYFRLVLASGPSCSPNLRGWGFLVVLRFWAGRSWFVKMICKHLSFPIFVYWL